MVEKERKEREENKKALHFLNYIHNLIENPDEKSTKKMFRIRISVQVYM